MCQKAVIIAVTLDYVFAVISIAEQNNNTRKCKLHFTNMSPQKQVTRSICR